MVSISQVAQLLHAQRDDVRAWVMEYAEFLTPSANPPRGTERQFSQPDLRVLSLIAAELNGGADEDDIRDLLMNGAQDQKARIDWARLHSPLFEDVPSEVDETWQHGALLGGMASRDLPDVAKSYRAAADELLKQALSAFEPHELDYPILFLYRHCIELYLKSLLPNPPEHHDLGALIRLLEQREGQNLSAWARERLWEFHRIDRISDVFRYAGGPPEGELWIDFYQLQAVMHALTEAFEKELRAVRP